ncbi:MAG: glycosyltransferase family 4 protein [Verrucomicrobia subdivision 3 bacterium]|nr:glycosyltransferase family 4 protein [Limisphaerales bacterium]
MNLVQITPGAGGMYCGNCFRDNALVERLRKLGHSALMVPLYLPLNLDDTDQSSGTPIFFSGINVYLDQQSTLFRRAPGWLRNALSHPRLLRWAAGRAAKTRATDLGELTVSMLRGEEGNQIAELDKLIAWLRAQPKPDAIFLSNVLLAGLARRLQHELDAPVFCHLQGEDSFLDGLPEPFRGQAWDILVKRCGDIALFIAPSHYFGQLMAKRLQLPSERVRVVYNGIKLDGFAPAPAPPDPPVLGYFARMCREKGIDTLVDAFLVLKRRDRIKGLRLKIGGSLGPADEPFVEELKQKLAEFPESFEFHPNLDLLAKQQFYRSLTVMSVPALYGEAFGLYVIEALASAVPVVQPSVAAFPELITATGGGLLCEPGSVESLADAVESLLANPEKARRMGLAGREAVVRDFDVQGMTEKILETVQAHVTPGFIITSLQ